MESDYVNLARRAFGPDSRTLTNVAYLSYQEALQFLTAVLRQPGGIGLLHGPAGAGKTTIAANLVDKVGREAAVALVDGARIKPRQLLGGILEQFGLSAGSGPDDELLQQVAEFAGEQSRIYQTPVVIIDNADRMYPGALRVLNALAALEAGGRPALRLVLTGGSALKTLVASQGMRNLGQRSPGMYVLKPLAPKEALIYLHARLQAAGSERADTVFPFDVCDRLRELSGGWPGILNRCALESLERAQAVPVSIADTVTPEQANAELGDETRTRLAAPREAEASAEIPTLGADEAVGQLPPRIVVSRDGKLLGTHRFADKRLLIGRSDFADVVLEDDYVSKLHAILLLYSDALVLLDLNSANGTTVNSVKVTKTILRSNDIISLGHHRLKVENAPALSPEVEQLLQAPDTLKMKNLLDLRKRRARKIMEARTGKVPR